MIGQKYVIVMNIMFKIRNILKIVKYNINIRNEDRT
jgi:hypothetical protein